MRRPWKGGAAVPSPASSLEQAGHCPGIDFSAWRGEIRGLSQDSGLVNPVPGLRLGADDLQKRQPLYLAQRPLAQPPSLTGRTRSGSMAIPHFPFNLPGVEVNGTLNRPSVVFLFTGAFSMTSQVNQSDCALLHKWHRNSNPVTNLVVL